MAKQLTQQQIDAFHDHGFVFPIRIFGEDDAQHCIRRLHEFEQSQPTMSRDEVHHKLLRFKSHVLLPWINELIRHEKILDAVEDLLGPDIMCWSSSFFIKDPNDPGYISWHQDSATYNLEGGELITAWLALTDAQTDNGAMRFIPGSHRIGEQTHTDTWAENNQLSRGETVNHSFDEASAVDIRLAPGEISLHHIHAIHSSAANRSPRPRIGFAMRYFSPSMRYRGDNRESAMLVRGEDRYGYYELEPSPQQNRPDEARAAYERAIRARSMTTFRDAKSERSLHQAAIT